MRGILIHQRRSEERDLTANGETEEGLAENENVR